MRFEKKFSVENIDLIKKKITYWADNQGVDMLWLDSNDYPDTFGKYDAVLAFLPHQRLVQQETKNAFENLKSFIKSTNDWIFGYFSYDLKNDIEKLHSNNEDNLHFPEISFFQPKKIIFFDKNNLIFSYFEDILEEIDTDFDEILYFSFENHQKNTKNISISSKISKKEYIEKVEHIQQHIARGDIYEANFCQEFYAKNLKISPLPTFWQLNEISKPPFAVFLKFGKHYVLSASPERYLQRTDNQLITQPIKGTARRSPDPIADQKLQTDLVQNPKERSENIMIVDLVRNDLSLTAERGSVKVLELCKLHTFKQVHQLISTVTSMLKKDIHSVDAIRTTFPMGSMTGAPKISAMQIIENQEVTKRGVYSGSIGYFSPNGDFDLNVVIRSILYNAENQYVSFSVGSAITANADPEKEYEECLIKANAMKQVLESF